MSAEYTPRAGRPRRWLLPAGIAAIIVAGAVGWAGATVFLPPEDPLDANDYTLVDVASGTVGSTLSLNVVGEWSPEPEGSNNAAGTVTSVAVVNGDVVNAGDVLYSVDLRPIVIVAGETPAFRSLSVGSTGADVQQLQQFLADRGLYHLAIDGDFGWGTAQSVKAWQRSLGVEADGVVHDGDIIFVPSLPARIWIDESAIAKGNRLGGGEKVVSVLPNAPVFTIPITDAQSAVIPSSVQVEIDAPSGSTWSAAVVDRHVDVDGQLRLQLAPLDDTEICGDECAQVPVQDQVVMPARIQLVAPVTGLIVPSAALLSKADGRVVVIDGDGDEHEVTVVASAQGMSAIDGVSEGMSVRIPVGR